MRTTPTFLARFGAAATLVALASVAVVAPASAGTTGTVGVVGGSLTKIELTIPNDTAAFGTNLTPDGDASNAAGVTANEDSATIPTGTCYELQRSVRVRSNRVYDLSVDANADKGRLDFLTADPADFDECTGGEPVDTDMYTAASGVWADALAKTARTTTDFWLGLAVLWADEPDANLATVTLTFTATANS